METDVVFRNEETTLIHIKLESFCLLQNVMKFCCVRRQSGTAKIYTQRKIQKFLWITFFLILLFGRLVQGQLKTFNYLRLFHSFVRRVVEVDSKYLIISASSFFFRQVGRGQLRTSNHLSFFVFLNYNGHCKANCVCGMLEWRVTTKGVSVRKEI